MSRKNSVFNIDPHSEEHIPGTEFIFADVDHHAVTADGSEPLKDGDMILYPQPSNSPNDPLNWSKARKYWHAFLVCLVTGFTAATSNDAGAAQDGMNADLEISWGSFNTGAGVLFIGIGYFTLLLSPSTTLYGRKFAYLICILVGLAGSIWFGRTKRTSDAVWSQLFVGASESVAEAQVQLSLSEIFFQHQLGGVLGVYILATSIGTYLGPLIAGYIADGVGWRWVGNCGAICSAFVFLLLLFGLEETYFDRRSYKTSYFEQRDILNETIDESKNESTETTNVNEEEKNTAERQPSISYIERAAIKTDEPKTYWQRIQIFTFATNLQGTGFKQYIRRLWLTLRVFAFPPVIYAGLMWGFQDAWLTFYLTTEDDLWYGAPWNYGDAGVALMNVPCLIGAVIGCIYAGYLSDYLVEYIARKNNGIKEAETRLWFMMLSGLINPVGLILFGVGSDKGWSWPVPYVGLGFIGFGWGCTGDLAMSYLADCYPEMILEGMVGVSVINNTIGMIFSFACDPWNTDLGVLRTYISIAVLDFGFTVLFTLIMIVFGKKCRIMTKSMYYNFVEERDGMD